MTIKVFALYLDYVRPPETRT